MSPPKLTLQLTEVFNWMSEDGATAISFRVTAMLNDIADGTLPFTPLTSVINQTWVRKWLPLREPNQDVVRSMTKERRDTPVLGVWMPDSTVLLIDGTHRYLRLYLDRVQYITWHIVTDPAWRAYAAISGPLAEPIEFPLA